MVFVSYKFNENLIKKLTENGELLSYSFYIGNWISQKMDENGIEYMKNKHFIYFDCRDIGIYDDETNYRQWGTKLPYIKINGDKDNNIIGISIRALTHIGDDKMEKIVNIVDEYWSKMDSKFK